MMIWFEPNIVFQNLIGREYGVSTRSNGVVSVTVTQLSLTCPNISYSPVEIAFNAGFTSSSSVNSDARCQTTTTPCVVLCTLNLYRARNTAMMTIDDANGRWLRNLPLSLSFIDEARLDYSSVLH